MNWLISIQLLLRRSLLTFCNIILLYTLYSLHHHCPLIAVGILQSTKNEFHIVLCWFGEQWYVCAGIFLLYTFLFKDTIVSTFKSYFPLCHHKLSLQSDSPLHPYASITLISVFVTHVVCIFLRAISNLFSLFQVCSSSTYNNNLLVGGRWAPNKGYCRDLIPVWLQFFRVSFSE